MKPTAQALIAKAKDRLTLVSGDDALAEAKLLIGHVLGLTRTQVSVMRNEEIAAKSVKNYTDLIDRRVAREPISHIIGSREFWGREFKVTSDVLDPRPDTETLIDVALQLQTPQKILDLGTGSGCILLTLLSEWSNATGLGIDQSEAALNVSSENATLLGLAERSDFVQSNWFEKVEGKFDLIVSNPPYISEPEFQLLEPSVKDWEPKSALVPNEDGLGAYRLIADGVRDFLSDNGCVLLEIGWQQAKPVTKLFNERGYINISVHQDLDGRDRVLRILK